METQEPYMGELPQDYNDFVDFVAAETDRLKEKTPFISGNLQMVHAMIHFMYENRLVDRFKKYCQTHI